MIFATFFDFDTPRLPTCGSLPSIDIDELCHRGTPAEVNWVRQSVQTEQSNINKNPCYYEGLIDKMDHLDVKLQHFSDMIVSFGESQDEIRNMMFTYWNKGEIGNLRDENRKLLQRIKELELEISKLKIVQ